MFYFCYFSSLDFALLYISQIAGASYTAHQWSADPRSKARGRVSRSVVNPAALNEPRSAVLNSRSTSYFSCFRSRSLLLLREALLLPEGFQQLLVFAGRASDSERNAHGAIGPPGRAGAAPEEHIFLFLIALSEGHYNLPRAGVFFRPNPSRLLGTHFSLKSRFHVFASPAKQNISTTTFIFLTVVEMSFD